MKYLTTYLDDEINFKFGNNGSIIELKAVDDHAVMSFSNEEKLLIRIKNEESYIKTVPVTAERKIIQLPTKLLKDLTVGQYDVELWQGEGDNQIIYPDEGFLRLKIHGNTSQIDGSLVSSITLADFEKKFNELAKKIEDKLKNLPDVDSKINVDVKVEDGHLIINGNDTGVDLTAHDGKDGHDGHTPVITVSNKGSLIIDGVDTNKSLIGPRGADGVPGIDGHDGKSAYQVALDNGFDGTEVEWLRSLHGNDGLDGKSGQNGVNGLSAYELAQKNGFVGTEQEWLDSLKGRDGQDADDVDLSNYITNDQLKDIDKKFATKSEIPSLNGYARKTDLSNYATKDDLKTVTSNTTRHAPTAWTLDRTTNPWTIWFDNGCGLQFLDYSTAPTIYGYGFSVNTQNTNIDAWPLMGTIISASRGTLTLDNISKLHGSADYWGPNTTVINPIKTDASNYDWSNVYFNDEDRAKSDDYHYNRQRNIFRVMYELGIWSIDDIKPFGLTKKEG